MSIIDHINLKDELLEAMTERAITSTGDFDIFNIKLLDQWCIADQYLKDLDVSDKHCFIREIDVSVLALVEGEGIDEIVGAFKDDLCINLNKHIQEKFVPQMQPILDNYWKEREYE